MAHVFLIGLERTTADQIGRVVSIERHKVCEGSYNCKLPDLAACSLVFAGGDPWMYLPLLQRVRRELPTLPFVIVTKKPDAAAWLRAIDMGATDFLVEPVWRRQIQWVMESVIPLQAKLSEVSFSPGYSMRRCIRAVS
jgi:DNA-binding NtrC family response regulator